MSISSVVNSVNWMVNSRPVQVAIGVPSALLLYRVWESAISHTLVVDTCRHGTSLQYYPSIWLLGLDPKKCTCDTGSNGRPKAVYVWRDSRLVDDKREVKLDGPQYYSENPFTVLKFHFRPDDSSCASYWDRSHRLHQDGYPGMTINDRAACRTRYASLWTPNRVYSYHVGITGSLTQGINFGLPKRICYNPIRFGIGAAQGAIALYLTHALCQKRFGFRLIPETSKLALWPKKVGDAALKYRAIKWPAKFCEAAWSYRAIRWPLKAAGAAGLWAWTV